MRKEDNARGGLRPESEAERRIERARRSPKLDLRGLRLTAAPSSIGDRADQDALASILNVLGIALNYADDARLRDPHVPNPYWITDGVAA
jgi:hypothetical protein